MSTEPPLSADDLRRRAEAILNDRTDTRHDGKDKHEIVDALKTLHELQVHQIELEMQNDALQSARDDADAAAARYTDLYDFAPVAYATLDHGGVISQSNLAFSRLVNTERSRLVGKRLAAFIAKADALAFANFLRSAFAGEAQPPCVLNLHVAGGQPRTVLMDASQSEDRRACRVVLTDITQSHQIALRLAESEQRLQGLVETVDGIVWEADAQTFQFSYVSPQAERLLGYPCQRWTNEPGFWRDHIHPDDVTWAVDYCVKSTLQKQDHHFEYRMIAADGRAVWLHDLVTVVLKVGMPYKLNGLMIDITERKAAQLKEQLAANVFTHAREGIFITEASGCIVEVNDAFTRITGYSGDEVIGQNPRMLQSGRQSRDFYVAMWKTLTEQGHWSGEVWNRRKNGEFYAEMLTISVVRDAHGQLQNFVALFSDITLMKEHEKQLEHIAHFDSLTHLPNRVLLADRLKQALLQSQRRSKMLAVAYLDLDGFKRVNDQHGHAVGDDLLIAVSQHMKEALREGDTLARIGGDEFVAVLVDLEGPLDCEPLLARLLQAASQVVPVGDAQLQVSASIGVTLYPQDGADADLLLRQADQAMYIAKAAGKNRHHIFDIASADAVRSQLESLERIRTALAQREFVLYYQPKVNMKTGAVVGTEALIRWQHPQRGLLAPAAFLPLIEGHPISVDVGDWVINTALAQMSAWQAGGFLMPVSVNVGASQLQHGDFVARLRVALAAHPQVPPEQLELEILETSALKDVAQVSSLMRACLGLGVGFALDDFGTGYSSLTYLKSLPAALLKIDQSFVRDMLTDADDLAIVQGVIGLAGAFQRGVIAEGVETELLSARLLALGCELAQGYGIARPMPADDLPGWVQRWHATPVWTA